MANLKAKGGPAIHRTSFISDDVTAFKPFSEQGFEAGAWIFEDGSITIGSTTTPNKRYYAVFGETNWDHVQVRAELDPEGEQAGIAIGIQTSSSGVTKALITIIDELNGVLSIHSFVDGTMNTLKEVAIPPNIKAPYQLELVAYDDQLQARLDDALIVVERGAHRSGQLALVAVNVGSFKKLMVEALDAYRFYFQSSRFTSFEQHIQSSGNVTLVLPAGMTNPGEAQVISDLYESTQAEMQALMQKGADPLSRHTLFQRWADALMLPMVQQPQAFSISRLQDEAGTLLFVLESPEPLMFSQELQLIIKKEILQPGPLPRPVGIRALEDALPAEFDVLEPLIKKSLPGLRNIDIQPARVIAIMQNTVLDQLPVPPAFALAAIAFQGAVRYYLLQITIQVLGRNLLMVRGEIRDENDFIGLLSRPFIMAITGHMNAMQANEVYFLNKIGKLISKCPLPSLPVLPSFIQQEFTVLSNGEETGALLIPLEGNVPGIWTPGKYKFEFRLNRERYAHETADTNAEYVREVTVELTW